MSNSAHFGMVGFSFGIQSMDSPDFAEHGSEREGEAYGQNPSPGLADYWVLPGFEEAAVYAQQEYRYEAGYHAGQHYGVAHRMRRGDDSEKIIVRPLSVEIFEFGQTKKPTFDVCCRR